MIRALIFDFDGLLVETEVSDFQSWQEIFSEYNCILPLDSWAACIGSQPEPFDLCGFLETHHGRPVDADAIRTRHRQRYLELLEAEPLRPGVADYLSEAKRLGLKLAVASSSTQKWVAGHLERRGVLEHFDCIRCREDVTRTKPDPELFNSVLDALNLRREQAIVLEDSPNGIVAARRAGIFCVAVPNPVTCQLSLDQADLRLESLAETPLEELLATVRSKQLSP